jgi:riboflavin synthase
MFTGIVREIGTVRAVAPRAEARLLVVEAPETRRDASEGDSICVDGACLTVTGLQGTALAFDVGAETLRLTTLGGLRQGDSVNVEPSLRLGDRLGGHFVSGHVDGVGTVSRMDQLPGEVRLRVDVEPALTDEMIMKGSVAVDGISLTIAALGRGSFEVSLIPHTLAVSTMGRKRPGDRVNVECDMIGRWVRRLLGGSGTRESPALTVEQLEEQGF